MGMPMVPAIDCQQTKPNHQQTNTTPTDAEVPPRPPSIQPLLQPRVATIFPSNPNRSAVTAHLPTQTPSSIARSHGQLTTGPQK